MLKLKLGKKKSEAPTGDDANLPAVSDGAPGAEGEDGEAAPAKKKIPLLFIIIRRLWWCWAAAGRRPSC